MLGGFRATPFARLIFSICEEGFSKEIDHLSLLGFFQFHNSSKRPKLFQLSAQRVLSQAWGFQERLGKGLLPKPMVAYFRILSFGGGPKYIEIQYSVYGVVESWNTVFFKKDSNRNGIETRIQPPKFRPLKIQILFSGVVNHSWLFRCQMIVISE